MKKRDKGFSLIETMISITLATIVILAIMSLSHKTAGMNISNLNNLKAHFYATEVLEVANDLRISNWDTLKNANCDNSNPCYPEIISGSWTIVPGEEVWGIYTRVMEIEPVRRDSCSFPNDIVESGGQICPSSSNPDSLKVTSVVAWEDGQGDHEINLKTYVYKDL